MNDANMRWSLRLKEKYKTYLNLFREILEEILDSLASPSKSQLTFEEIPYQPSFSPKPTPRTPRKVVNREEIEVEDGNELQERRDHRANASTRIGEENCPYTMVEKILLGS